MEEKKEKKLSFKWLWMCILVLIVSLLVQLFVGLVGGIVVAIIGNAIALSQGIADISGIQQVQTEFLNNATGWLLVITHLMIILVFGLWYRFGVSKKIKTASLDKVFTRKNMGVTVLMAVSICFVVNFGMEVAVYVIPQSLFQSYVEMMELAGFGESILTTIAAVCLAPIGEELVYRGVCIYYAEKFVEKLDKAKAFWIANVMQALGFGIFHMNIIQGTYAFLMGLCLGYLAKRYKSIIPAMVAHSVINACSCFLWAPIYNVVPQSTVVYGICTLVCMVATAFAFKLGGNPLTEQND